MPQFDLTLYLYIFIFFSFLFFILYVCLNLVILPYFWQIFYIRYLKTQYNIFFNLLYRLEILHLNKLNSEFLTYLNVMFDYIFFLESLNLKHEIIDLLLINYFSLIIKE